MDLYWNGPIRPFRCVLPVPIPALDALVSVTEDRAMGEGPQFEKTPLLWKLIAHLTLQ